MTTPVVLMTRQNCSLCDKASEAVARICGELGVAWSSTDIDTDPELRAEYGDRVPVILIDGKEHGYFEVEEPRFRAALARRPR
ncbi:glutaredoxin family protein [Pseudonocardia spinosispora]|uniref:glutaredoxin family protein n=1 Tax=Pseudonocardia spinosispora TaxID=103441 RepID=UPI00040F607F|nr:glutaredoxin family protein [Pseudonocardia spinosispora]